MVGVDAQWLASPGILASDGVTGRRSLDGSLTRGGQVVEE